MDKAEKKSLCLNICCFGLNPVGVPVASVFAYKCPFLNVSVVDFDSKRVTSWNTKQINMHEQGLDEILKKCQNRNLAITSDMKNSIKTADLIFICLEAFCGSRVNAEENVLDFTDIEKAIKLVLEVSESSKIIVLKSNVPIGTSERIKHIISTNKSDEVKFVVLSVPAFLSAGNAVFDMLNPEKILIGSDLTDESINASETLAVLYSKWVPRERIKLMSNTSAEISRLGHNALLAQRLSSLSALSMICERCDADISEITNVINDFFSIGPEYRELTFEFGGPHLKNDLKSFIHMYERIGLKKIGEYWKEVLLMNEYQTKKFYKKIVSTYFNTLGCEKIALWGVGIKKNVDILDESLGIEICLNLLQDGAKVNLYDKLEKRYVIEELSAAATKKGLNAPLILKELTYCNDLYKAVHKADAIVVCNELDEFKELDFNLLYKDMIKPPYIFDWRKCLPHDELIKLGFIVKTVGKRFDTQNQ